MKTKAPRNRTLTCEPHERSAFASDFITLERGVAEGDLRDRIANQDFFTAAPYLPPRFIDLLVIDPPYNLTKSYNGAQFKRHTELGYRDWFRRVIELLRPALAPAATIYVCSDWKTSVVVAPILQEFFQVRNRITWERSKGRGARTNWKNNTEDIWYCTLASDYVFNVEDVKLKRKVIAPYRDASGRPKDWEQTCEGKFRLTHPSNIWTDITIPFWSMPENTEHPTQKPEKLVAKLILASSNKGDLVFDPFLGSGTTAVVAKKLGRHYAGIELDFDYCCLAAKRLSIASLNSSIQGYSEGIFWERNTALDQSRERPKTSGSIVIGDATSS